jgi:hypothetical protein
MAPSHKNKPHSARAVIDFDSSFRTLVSEIAMAAFQTTVSRHAAYAAPYQAADFRERLRDIDMFFQGNDRVHETMNRVAKRLESAGIAYAIVGRMAVNAHGHQRTTGDVDFLLTSESFNAFLRIVASGEFSRITGRPRRFLDPLTGITFDFLVTGMFPGSGKPGPVAYPDPSDVTTTIRDLTVVNLESLIQLKLAAGRHQDFADVVNLIAVHKLDESFAGNLATSLRGDYIECLEEKRREEEYEARQDEQFEQKIQDARTKAPPASGA